jgi:hypothetical protein
VVFRRNNSFIISRLTFVQFSANPSGAADNMARARAHPFLLLPKWNQNDLCGEGEKKGYQEAAIEEARIGWHIIL